MVSGRRDRGAFFLHSILRAKSPGAANCHCDELGSKQRRIVVAEGRMGAFGIAGAGPVGNCLAAMAEAKEQGFVREPILQPNEELFVISVFYMNLPKVLKCHFTCIFLTRAGSCARRTRPPRHGFPNQ